jgi:hypothetical protein
VYSDEPIMMATMKQANTMPNGGLAGIITRHESIMGICTFLIKFVQHLYKFNIR